MSRPDRPGRSHQRPPLFNLSAHPGGMLLIAGVVALLLWHLTLVVTARVPMAGLNVTIRGLMLGEPMNLPGYDPAGPGPTITLFASLVVAVSGLALWLTLRTPRNRKGAAGLATRKQARESAGANRARAKAGYTREGSVQTGLLDVTSAPLAEVGLHLGYTVDHHEPVVLTLEDQVAVMAPTGGGKTRYVMLNAALDAPGPLVATSTRPEILDAIAEARTANGRVWVFDPLDVAHWPEPMVWNPVAGADVSQHAASQGEAFAGGMSVSGTTQFFRDAASRVIARLLHAAALGGKDMESVLRWATDLGGTREPQEILENNPAAEILWAETLELASTGADVTVASTRLTLSQKIEPILSRLVLRQMLPAAGVPIFDPAAFVVSTDTLILITDDQAQTNVAPLTTMLLADVVDAAKAAAALSMTGRLDPPLRIVGDEVANVAPLPRLPGLLSDSRGNGIQWVVAFQSLAQVFARWGDEEGDQILSNLNCTIVLGGLQDTRALDRFSALAGAVDVTEVSSSVDANGVSSGRNITVTERTTLRTEEIRHLPEGRALVLYGRSPAMLVDLIQWKDRPDGDEITAAIKRARKARVGGR